MGGWRTLAVVGAVAAVAAPGCGGSDRGDSSEGGDERLTKADYQAEILGVLEDAARPTALYTDLVVEPRPQKACVVGVATLHDQIGELVDRVAALRPPADADAAHEDFIAAARISVDRIGAAREKVARGELSCGRELNQEIYGMPSTRKAERAIARLERRGYFVSGE